jgi:GcrA cell cycle regulator
MRGFPWTADRIEWLTQLWADGLSASQIASKLGGLTRSAVIGKVHRTGLPGRNKTRDPASYPKAPRKPQRRAPWAVKNKRSKPADDSGIPFAQRCTLLELNNSTCRWPIATEPFLFCGAMPAEGRPYCHEHCARAYQSAQPHKHKPYYWLNGGKAA